MHSACLFCGGDASEPHHRAHCDGRQGRLSGLGRLGVELHARSSDPDTSHASMAAVDDHTVLTAADTVVRLFRAHGPMADYELAPAFAAAWTAKCCDHLYRQARTVARDKGLVVDTGERRVNPTSGRKQIVWAAVAAGAAPPVLRFCETCGGLLRREQAGC